MSITPGKPADIILDIRVTLSLEVGRTQISVRELLKLAPGSVVRLDRAAGEPFDVKVNGRSVARGEVVTSNERYAVRMAESLST